MTAVKWQQVKIVFGDALRRLFRGGTVPALRPRRIGSQPETQSDSGVADNEVAGAATISVPCSSPPQKTHQSLAIGQIVAGRFENLRFLSSGGMGEVYEVWDCDLRERVALKTIRPEIASSPSVIERFKQEVKQARAITHPNVCRVYEVFSHESTSGDRIWFLTMELLDGTTLSERLRQNGPFAPKQALGLIEQMVAGLAAAHELSIVHRDFKSSNVMLVSTGSGKIRAVVMDFGLALTVMAAHQGESQASMQGTPIYMAPEQEHDGHVGFAADQYALGVVISEMLTGRRPSRPDRSGKVLLPAGSRLSPLWEAVIRRCLEFHPENRFRQVRDVTSALNPVGRLKRARITGAVVAIIIGAAFLIWIGNRDIRIEGVAQLTPSTDNSGEPSLSRDGTIVAYSSDRADTGNLDIWVQRLASGRPIRLTTSPAEDVDPSISPDGRSVVFRSERSGRGIYLSDTAEGSERFLIPDGRDPRFSPDGGSVVYWIGDPDETVASGQLFVFSLADGSMVRLAADFKDARYPLWSSDGQFILFTGCRTGDQPLPKCFEWWVTSRDGDRVQNTGALALLHRQQIQPVDTLGGWDANTVIFSGRRADKRSVWKLTVSQRSLLASGRPLDLTSGYASNVDQSSAVAENGMIAFSQLSAALHIWRVEHALSSKAMATKTTQDVAFDISPYVSHDGHWLVFSRGTGTHHDIWIKDTQSGRESLFLASSLDKSSPIVDEAGETVAFEVSEQDSTSIFTVIRGKVAGVLCTGCSKPTGWFDGNRAIFYQEGLPSKIKMATLETRDARVVLEAAQASLSEASWSPENQYLLFTAFNSGDKKRVFAVRFPKLTGRATGEWIPITDEEFNGDRARWSGDGKTVFFLSNRDGSLCVWGQHFEPKTGKVKGHPFAVVHFHNSRISPETVMPNSFELSVCGDTVYLNLGEVSASIWTGVLKHQGFYSFLDQLR